MTEFFYAASGIRWQDILDIALNSYILFRLYVLFRETNAFKVLVGLVVFWFFQRIAVSIGLIVTSWAAQGIMAAAAIIIVVVFRNEIHSVLQAKKLRAVLWGFPQKILPTSLDIIIESSFELSRTRTGALIVLPGKDDLKEVVQSGIPLRGHLSKEMLLSIFWRDNPVHDGAVIVRGDLIQEVGVILPLTHEKDLPIQYGTRHRAALGLAENTDATIIVVSEETGNIHIATRSEWHLVNRREELAKRLRVFLGVTPSRTVHKQRERFQLGTAALVSVLFVLGIWFSFSRGLESLVSFDVTLQYMNRDPAVQILESSQNSVRLHLGGSGPLIRSISPDQVQVRVDLGKARVGENTFTITAEHISLPPGVFLQKIEKPTVRVILDSPFQKTLPIQVNWIGALPRGLRLKRVTLDPNTTQVIGSNQILETVTTIYTEGVSLEKIKESGRLTVNLVLDPPSLKIAQGHKGNVTVDYVLEKRK